MKPDDFEKQLERQVLRQIPGAWREEILSAANSAARSQRDTRLPELKTKSSILKTLFWPHPKAWAALAAVWVVIFVLRFSVREESPTQGGQVMTRAPQMLATFREQQLILAELFGQIETRDADVPKPSPPRPRSQGRPALLMV